MAVPKRKSDAMAEPIAKVQPTNQQPFTGIARSVKCFNNQGHKNFKILKLHVVDGIVTKVEESDAYASFECIARLEIANEISIIHLNNTWADGANLES